MLGLLHLTEVKLLALLLDRGAVAIFNNKGGRGEGGGGKVGFALVLSDLIFPNPLFASDKGNFSGAVKRLFINFQKEVFTPSPSSPPLTFYPAC